MTQYGPGYRWKIDVDSRVQYRFHLLTRSIQAISFLDNASFCGQFFPIFLFASELHHLAGLRIEGRNQMQFPSRSWPGCPTITSTMLLAFFAWSTPFWLRPSWPQPTFCIPWHSVANGWRLNGLLPSPNRQNHSNCTALACNCDSPAGSKTLDS